MPPARFRKIVERVMHLRAGGRQTQQDISPAPPSANIASNDTPTTGSNHDQQNRSRDRAPSTFHAYHQQPPAAQSLWDEAYEALAKDVPDLVKDYDELLAKEEQMANSVPNETSPSHLPAPHGLDTRSDRSRRQDQLSTVIQNGLRRMEDMETTYDIGGHEFVLANQSTQVTNLLLWGKDWIGNAVDEAPEASIVWSGVCVVIPLLTNPAIAAEANRDGFAYVTSRMRYYVTLEPLLRRLGQNTRVDAALITAVNDHIVDLFQAILEFQLSTVLRFYRSRLDTPVHDNVPPKDWRETRRELKRREEAVTIDLDKIEELTARQEVEPSDDTRATLESILSVATQQLNVMSRQLAAVLEQVAVQEDVERKGLVAKKQKCLQLFCLTRKSSDAMYDWYKDRVEPRAEGTCKWFLRHEKFQKWLLQESGPLLVSADPGCGKSVLARYLVDHGLAQQSATICYFFFKDQDQNTIRQALCALLHQLFLQKSALIQHVMELYGILGPTLVQSESSLWTIMKNAVRDPEAGPVIFVIDALDECAESQLSSFITNLEDIFCNQQQAHAKLKVLMTSRPYEQVVSEFYSLQDVFPQLHIPGEEDFETISEEINSVIHHRVEQLAEKHQLSDHIKSTLASKLLAIEHRTYLWVYLMFDYLDRGFKRTADGIETAIQTLPKSINQAYDQILNRSQDNATVKTVRNALSIILAARRPLSVSEMNIAMNLDGRGRGRPIYDLDLEEDVDFKSRLRSLCGLFVNVHHDKIYFLHQSAREFLIQSLAETRVSSDLQWHHSITTRHAQSVLAEICLFYLNMLNSTDEKTFLQHDRYGAFLQYSVEHWDDHCREARFEKGSAMVDLASRLCTPDSTSHSVWASIISRRYHLRPESNTNVLVASHLGLTPVAELLVSRRADIEAKDSQGRTALMLATRCGHEDVIQLLLENGANVEARDDDGTTALIYAARSGHEAVRRLLVENGADIEAKDKYGWTALSHPPETATDQQRRPHV